MYCIFIYIITLDQKKINREECVIIERVNLARDARARAHNKYYASYIAMTMAVELRMTAITGVLELRSELNPSGQLVVSVYKVVIKAIIEFSCVQYVEK